MTRRLGARGLYSVIPVNNVHLSFAGQGPATVFSNSLQSIVGFFKPFMQAGTLFRWKAHRLKTHMGVPSAISKTHKDYPLLVSQPWADMVIIQQRKILSRLEIEVRISRTLAPK